MTFRPTTLERAFELARTGEYAGVAEITKQLRAEGFATSQLTGATLLRQLRGLCQTAREEGEAGSA
jgi:hypothetical protein